MTGGSFRLKCISSEKPQYATEHAGELAISPHVPLLRIALRGRLGADKQHFNIANRMVGSCLGLTPEGLSNGTSE